MPDFIERPLEPTCRDFPPWVSATDSVWAPITAVYESKRSFEAMLTEVYAIIDRCEKTNAPARMAINLCDLACRQDVIDAIAAKYSIPGEVIRADEEICRLPIEWRPTNHWTVDLRNHIRERPDPRSWLALPIRRG